MGKNKLQKFAEMQALPNVFQCPAKDIVNKDFRLQAGSKQSDFAGKWHTVFGNDNPIVLELGCGKGEYTVGLAKRYPNKNFIGVDIKGARMWTGAKQAFNEGITNAAFLRTNIEVISQFFMPNEVAEIWLTFSDPQMKKPNKRLTSTGFLSCYRMFLQHNGKIHLKTDSLFLYTYTLELLKKNNISPLFCTTDLYGENRYVTSDSPANNNQELPLDLDIRTHYEQQWLDRGINIKYLLFSLPDDITLLEPETDIEFDTYRSYGRGTTPTK